ncbi:hypothetical protein B5M42_023315 [Paenibacillus athensensis]|nr:hypothetical protein [Paenibacillus athensensis]MCD1261736.1 hypothetical protein [Paenibacillus athensensis]
MVVIGIVLNYARPAYASTSSYGTQVTSADGGIYQLEGDFFNPILYFNGFDSYIENENLYVRIRQRVVSFWRKDSSQNGFFHFAIDTSGQKVRAIYVVGSSKEETKLLWRESMAAVE